MATLSPLREPAEPLCAGASDHTFAEYFRCPVEYARFHVPAEIAGGERFFVWRGSTCYGRYGTEHEGDARFRAKTGARRRVPQGNPLTTLPFDLAAVATNLRQERYISRNRSESTWQKLQQRLYYLCRPALPVPIRKHLQRIRLRDWQTLEFPRWPVDVTIETLMREVMRSVLEASGLDKVPFIWFWPDGARACVMVTHDVEGVAGEQFAAEVMDLDDSFDIRTAFQIIPKGPRADSTSLMQRCRARGVEVNLHDLHHDGRLFRSREEFRLHVREINRLAREHSCRGFRSGAMYRQQSWYDAFELSFDMSVPNVAHLEPQRGGCCTVMPYFVGDVLELPLTTTQDYSLFHILNEYSIRLWMEQIDEITQQHGLISFIVHPDYVRERRALKVYSQLLLELSRLRAEQGAWVASPGEIDTWWRNRNSMSLVRVGEHWRVEGPGRHRARVAFAAIEDGQVVYRWQGGPA